MFKLVLYLGLISLFGRIFALPTSREVENNQGSELLSMEQDLSSEEREMLEMLMAYLLDLNLDDEKTKDGSSVEKRFKMNKFEKRTSFLEALHGFLTGLSHLKGK